jgi:hypothetical protein
MMDILLSLPVVSYFFLPSVSSYSISLNLLFFYLTWSTLILSHSAIRIEIIGTLAIRIIFFLAPSTLFLLFDSLIPSLAAPTKLQGASALPVPPSSSRRRRTTQRRIRNSASISSSGADSGPYAWWKVVLLSTFNILLGTVLQAGVELLLTTYLRRKSALKVTTTLPLPWSIGKDLVRCFVLRELLQYYIHRFLLHPQGSRNRSTSTLGKWHNCFAHAFTAPFSFVAHFDHPLTWLLWRWIPVYLPAMLLRLHLLTFFLFLALVSMEEAASFSGYTSVPTLIFSGMTKRQDLHLETRGQGNFGAWGLLDWLHGTTVGTGLDEDIEDEWDKHDGSQRVMGALDGAKEGGRRALNAARKRR